jgi:hypothetical protein
MPTTARHQQRYDHRLRNLVERTGDVTVATDLGVPRSTARGWLGAAPTVVVRLDEPPRALALGRQQAAPVLERRWAQRAMAPKMWRSVSRASGAEASGRNGRARLVVGHPQHE